MIRGNMQPASTLIKGTLLKRYKRFLADVELQDGQIVTAHCPNTGAMTGCAEPGYNVFLSESNNPKRKLAFTWELAKTHDGDWIGINTHNANKLVAEAISNNVISQLQGYAYCKPEVKYGSQNSRIDFLLSDAQRPDCYVEVKSVTLLDNGCGYFPDAKTTRGTKHLMELSEVASEGKRAVLLFCVQHSGIQRVSVAKHIDPLYAQAMRHAVQQGVEIFAYGCQINEQKVEINQQLEFN